MVMGRLTVPQRVRLTDGRAAYITKFVDESVDNWLREINSLFESFHFATRVYGVKVYRLFAQWSRKVSVDAKFFQRCIFFEKMVRVDASDSSPKSSGSELSSQLFGAVRSFAARKNLGKKHEKNLHATLWQIQPIYPGCVRICFTIRTNPRTIGRIRQKVACGFFVL